MSCASITIRRYRPGDAPALLSLFRDTIRRVNCRDYTPEQIRAWASDEIDEAAWSARFTGRFVPIAEIDGRIVGFAELEPDGHIDRFYVSADFQRRGVGRALMNAIYAEAHLLGIPRLFTEASISARPFFESQGFSITARQTVVCRGVEFENYRMTTWGKLLNQAQASSLLDRTDQLVELLAGVNVSRLPTVEERLSLLVEELADRGLLEKYGYFRLTEMYTKVCDQLQYTEPPRIKTFDHCGRTHSYHTMQAHVRCPVCKTYRAKTRGLFGEDDLEGVACLVLRWLKIDPQTVPGWNAEVDGWTT